MHFWQQLPPRCILYGAALNSRIKQALCSVYTFLCHVVKMLLHSGMLRIIICILQATLALTTDTKGGFKI